MFEIHFGDEFLLSQELTSIPHKKNMEFIHHLRYYYVLEKCFISCICVCMVDLAHDAEIWRVFVNIMNFQVP